MKNILSWIVFLPLALLALIFAVVNRQIVDVVIDPFGSDIAGLHFAAPLFLVMFVCAALGVLLGGLFTWVRQGRHRRALRTARAEIAELRGERDRLLADRKALPDQRDHAA